MVQSRQKWLYKMQPISSPPTLLDGLELESDSAVILQSYRHFDQTFQSIHNKIIVFVMLGEYHDWQWVEELLCQSHNYYLEHGHLDKYYIVLHTHDYPESVANEYSNYFTLIKDNSLYSYYTDKFPQIELSTTPKKFHFLSLNNRADVNRQSLFYFFHKFSLLDKSIFSYLADLNRSPFDSLDDISESCGKAWYLNNLNLTDLNKTLPKRITGDQFVGNDWGLGQDYYYRDAFCSLVMETYTSQQYPFLTEKTFKPLAFYHPFVLNSNKGGLQLLRDMGFKTFGKYWDESYDLLDGNQRLEAIFHLLLEISGWSLDRVNDTYKDMIPILQHNHDHFFQQLPIQYNSNFVNHKETINQLVKQKQDLLA
jgi:hypothetical protein